MKYFSTFITGFEEVVKDNLSLALKDVEIELVSDGLIIYKSSSSLQDIKNVRFLNNSFMLLRKTEKLSPNPIKDMIKRVLHDPKIDNDLRNLAQVKNKAFRVRASIENQFVAIDSNLMKNLENMIERSAKLRLNRSLPDIEFIFLTRREGFGLFGIRFTQRSNYEKTLEKGELYPELANILCLVSEPNRDDVFFDPFCGSGAIPIQRMTSFAYKQIYAGDNNPASVSRIRNKIAKLHGKIDIGKWDGLNLRSFSDNSIDKIVTDPPWGLHATGQIDISTFYPQMLRELYRILRVGGIVVILTAQKEILEEELKQFGDSLKLEAYYHTLVSGKKAGVYKIRKIS